MLFGQCDEGFAGAFLYAGGVDNGEFVIGEAFGGHVVEGFKCLFCDGLVGFVVADESAEVVRGEDFGWFEVGVLANVDLPEPDAPMRTTREISGIVMFMVYFLLNMAICVGGPASGSTGPMGLIVVW